MKGRFKKAKQYFKSFMLLLTNSQNSKKKWYIYIYIKYTSDILLMNCEAPNVFLNNALFQFAAHPYYEIIW